MAADPTKPPTSGYEPARHRSSAAVAVRTVVMTLVSIVLILSILTLDAKSTAGAPASSALNVSSRGHTPLAPTTPSALQATNGYGVNDYPYRGYARGSIIDPWRFYNGYCTSFVAWRLNELRGRTQAPWVFSNFMTSPSGAQVQFGNGGTWDYAAAAMGWRVDHTPTVGAVAQWHGFEGAASGSALGHVAVVTAVNPNGTVNIEEYNWSSSGAYDQRFGVTAPRYIHVPGGPAPEPPLPDPAVAPFAHASRYVGQQYGDFAARAATANETRLWQTAIVGGTPPSQVVGWLINDDASVRASTAPLVRLYLAFFNRAPDLGGYTYWSTALRGGTPAAAVASYFAQSAEFAATYGRLDDNGFVSRVYLNVLHRAPDASGAAYWLGRLRSGLSRGGLMLGFSESAENIATTVAKVEVAQLYLGMLRRPPDAGGWTYWTGQVAHAGSPSSSIDAIRLSAEYAARF